MPETIVVHVHDLPEIARDLDKLERWVYIGRKITTSGFCHDGSPYANPFKISDYGSREDVVELYRRWVKKSDDPRAVYIREHVEELRGKILGCWCKPNACHGDVLLEMIRASDSSLKVPRNAP